MQLLRTRPRHSSLASSECAPKVQMEKWEAAFVRGEHAMQNFNKPRYRACPHCRGRHFHRTQWKGLVERCVLYLWGLQPYQCRECYKRFYMRPAPQADSAPKEVEQALTERIPKGTASIATHI